jgi:hypothetical protein
LNIKIFAKKNFAFLRENLFNNYLLQVLGEISKRTALKNDLDSVDNHNVSDKLMHPKSTTAL